MKDNMGNTSQHRGLAIRLAALTALTPFAIDTYLAAIPRIAEDLQSDVPTINLSISVYLFGFALGQLAAGPLSDRIGRRPIALTGLTIFIVSSLAIVLSHSSDNFIFWRFIQALGGGGASVVSAAIVRDRFQGQESARIFATIGMIMMVAPLIAPGVGSIFLAAAGWHSIFIFLAAYAVLLMWIMTKHIPETKKEHVTPTVSLSRHYVQAYAATLRQTASYPYLFSQALVSGILLTVITNASFIFLTYFEVSQLHFPFYFASVPLASVVASRINLHLLRRTERRVILRTAAIAQLLITALLVLYTWMSTPVIWVTMALICSVIATIGFIYANNLSLYLDFHGKTGGSANAIFGCATFAAGALFGGVSSLFYDGTLLPISILIGVCSLLSFMSLFKATAEASPQQEQDEFPQKPSTP
ncbi:multidrug effflux MFS transporter [Pseudomaricurvus hydrocarbonicus]